MPSDYASFLKSPFAAAWKKFGIKRRAGVCTPLFSIYSKNSVGIGEIPDLEIFATWCKKSGLSILQLLPMNDTGSNFRPYDAQSAFALEPAYLSLTELAEMPAPDFSADIEALKTSFPTQGLFVDYRIKSAKLELLRKIFNQCKNLRKNKKFNFYVAENQNWLEDYVLFIAAKDKFGNRFWGDWPIEIKNRQPEALKSLALEKADVLEFNRWLQWQLFEQISSAKTSLNKKGVWVFGDIPFLVSRDSADVWSHPECYKLHLASGAPPDALFADGQKWGMPPYNWPVIEKRNYDIISQKLAYAQNFFDLFRIDHFVGLFRIWSIPLEENRGFFDPLEESVWEEHGQKILEAMKRSTSMLPCAEDLGTVPACAVDALKKNSILGMDVQRWTRKPRVAAMAVLSTHDTSSLAGWWEFEADTVDETMFRMRCGWRHVDADRAIPKLFDLERSFHGRLRWREEITMNNLLWNLEKEKKLVEDFIEEHEETFGQRKRLWKLCKFKGSMPQKMTPALAEAMLKLCGDTPSIFSIQLLQDWLSVSKDFDVNAREFRINFPGTISCKNWSMRMPFSIEKMIDLGFHEKISSVNKKSARTA